MHRLLADKRRRVAIDSLRDAAGPLDLEELATEVAERSVDVDASDDSTTQRIATALHHEHLPILANANVVEYDPETHRVVPDRELLDSFEY